MSREQFGRFDFAPILRALFAELLHGSPDPAARTFVLNQGDVGLLAALDRLSAAAASTPAGGSSIAAHVDHLRYGLSLLNCWARGEAPPWPAMDWTQSWQLGRLSDEAWRGLKDDLRREAVAWSGAFEPTRPIDEVEAAWLAGSVVHLGYHLGAIRQLTGALRGPSAADEARSQGRRPGS